MRDLDRAIWRITHHLYDLHLDEHDEVRMVCCIQKNSKKKKSFDSPVFKYGIEVLMNVEHAIEIDRLNGNTLWQDDMVKEVKALLDLDCFEFKPAGYHM